MAKKGSSDKTSHIISFGKVTFLFLWHPSYEETLQHLSDKNSVRLIFYKLTIQSFKLWPRYLFLYWKLGGKQIN